MENKLHAGLGVACPPRPWEVVQLFGSLGDPSEPAEFPSFTQTLATTWESEPCAPTRLWSVSVRSVGRQRVDQQVFSPLSNAAISSDSGSYANRSVLAKLALTVSGDALATEVFLVDADQSFELYAGHISVDLLTPQNVQNVRRPTRPPLEFPAGELVVDELVGCSIDAIDVSRGARDAALTQHLFVPDGEVASSPIPRGATELRISARSGDDDSGAWTLHTGDPATLSGTVGLGELVPDTARALVPSATHIASDAVAADRFFTLTWTIRF